MTLWKATAISVVFHLMLILILSQMRSPAPEFRRFLSEEFLSRKAHVTVVHLPKIQRFEDEFAIYSDTIADPPFFSKNEIPEPDFARLNTKIKNEGIESHENEKMEKKEVLSLEPTPQTSGDLQGGADNDAFEDARPVNVGSTEKSGSPKGGSTDSASKVGQNAANPQEGVQIPKSQTEERDWRVYTETIAKMLLKHKFYPLAAQRLKQVGTVLLEIEISRSGHIVSKRVINSSGFPILDNAAMESLENLGKFPPFPETISANSKKLRLPFRYSLN